MQQATISANEETHMPLVEDVLTHYSPVMPYGIDEHDHRLTPGAPFTNMVQLQSQHG